MTSRAAARRRRQREVAARWDQLQQIEETPETDSNGFLHVGVKDKDSTKSEKVAIANNKGHRTELQVQPQTEVLPEIDSTGLLHVDAEDKECKVRVQIGPRDYTSTATSYSYFLNSIAERFLCFGPGVLQEGQAYQETSFLVHMRNELGENRKSGRDEFLIIVQQRVQNEDGKEVLRDLPFELNDLNTGQYEVKYVAEEGEVEIHVKLKDENNKPRPVRGSPYKPTFIKTAQNRANDYSGPVVTQWITSTLKSLDEFYQTTNTGHQTKLKDGEVMNLIKVMNHIKDMYDQEDTLILRQDEIAETLAQLDREGVPSDKQLKQLKKIAGNLTQLKDDVVAKQKEIQPRVQKESDLYRKKIGEFEGELKVYQGGMRKEAYYFYKFGLELAMKRLTDVTADLDRFDQRMEDLNHIAVHFQYPEELAKPRKCMQAMRDDVANMRTLWEYEGAAMNTMRDGAANMRTIWEYEALSTNDKGTRTEPQGEKTRKKRKKKQNKKVQAPRDEDFDVDSEGLQSMSAEDQDLIEEMITELQRSADEDITVKILRAKGFDVMY